MILNYFEESIIGNKELPSTWKDQDALNDLENFLQENWNLRGMFYNDKAGKKQQFLSFLSHKGIRTNNYIGTIMFNGEQINIFPKVFRKHKTDKNTDELDLKHLMRNLIKWIEYCDKSYPFINITTNLEEEDSLKELFITLYVNYIRQTIDRGAYYEYIDVSDDLGFIKGKFDAADYFIRKIPNGQSNRFRCSYSKFEHDNKVNRIIKHTCRLIYPITTVKNRRIITSIFTRLNEVSDEKCTPSDCDKIRLSKMQNSYRIILSMSKMFLQNETVGLDFDFNESFCFLFPTEVLFEGFIGGFMQEVVTEYKGNAYLQKSDMYLIDSLEYGGNSFGNAFNMRNDILVEINDVTYILDTKYKAIPRFGKYNKDIKKLLLDEVDQGDLYQICEYARKRSVKDVFLLYPMYRYEDRELEYPIGISRGTSGDIRVHFVRLPFIFEDDVDKTKKLLKSIIEEILELKIA